MKKVWIAMIGLIGMGAGAVAPENLDGVNLRLCGKVVTAASRDIASSPVSVGFECLDRELFDPERCYEPLAQSGVKWARCQTGWNRCETRKGVYDFKWLDDTVNRFRRSGIEPWFNVGFGNPLYMDNLYSPAAVGCVPFYYGDEAWRAWQNYIRALAKHFKGRVRYFEIWNEPNIGAFWQPKGANPADYARLVRETGAIIRAEIPDAKIGACVSGAYSPYTAEFIATGIGSELAFFAVHPYSVQPELEYRNHLNAIRRDFDRHGGEKVALWQGECGYASWFPANHWLPPYVQESERNQAVWLLRRYVTDLDCGLALSSFFQTADMMRKDYKVGNETRPKPARHGLLNGDDYTPKAAYHAMRHIATLFDGQTAGKAFFTNGKLAGHPRNQRYSRLDDAALTVATFERKGYPMIVYYVAEDMQFGYPGMGDFELLVRPETARKLDDPVLIDPLNGNVYEIGGKKSWDQGFFFFQKLPLTDSPLIITDRKAVDVQPKISVPKSSGAW